MHATANAAKTTMRIESSSTRLRTLLRCLAVFTSYWARESRILKTLARANASKVILPELLLPAPCIPSRAQRAGCSVSLRVVYWAAHGTLALTVRL